VDYNIWAVMQHRVYHRQVHSEQASTVYLYFFIILANKVACLLASVDELKRRLIDVWCSLEQSIFDEAN